jgi:hypothetical protein
VYLEQKRRRRGSDMWLWPKKLHLSLLPGIPLLHQPNKHR